MNIFLSIVLCFGVYLKVCSAVDHRDCKAAVKQIEEREKIDEKRVKENIDEGS